MSTLFYLRIEFTGKSLIVRSEIPQDAHHVGLAPARWRRSKTVPFGDLTEFGSDLLEGEMELATGRLLRELRGAWEQESLFDA